MKAQPGDIFNDLTVIEYIIGTHKKPARYLVKCICGKQYGVMAYRLIGNKTKRCKQCANEVLSERCKEKYGYAILIPDNKLRFMWLNRYKTMVQRCYNPNRNCYSDYGGRGIKVCERWHDRMAFLEDIVKMSGWTNKKLQLDRTNNDGPYSPENCKIVSASENCLNRRTSKKNKAQIEQEEIEDEKPF